MPVKTASTEKSSSSKKNSKKELKFSKETYVKWYKDMLLIRKFEEKTGQLYIQQKFGGFCHLYIGQEAIVYNVLHDQFFPSIGCAPCTRAISLGEDFRAGRWWWEDETAKECGLHVKA